MPVKILLLGNHGSGKSSLVQYLKYDNLNYKGDTTHILKIEAYIKQDNGLPKAYFYDRYYGKGRRKASTIFSLGIGQGELGVTPLQMANIMCIIANKGYYYTPHIVKKIGDKTNTTRNLAGKHVTMVNASHFNAIQDGMQKVVEAGTARVARFGDFVICGKTGTAQNPHGKDHSLFVAFAPRENPKIAIAVMVENSGFGATWAAPVASLMMEKYLTDSIAIARMSINIKK